MIMHTIMIDGALYFSSRDLHLALKKMLSLPDYYGMNSDALNDCLSEKKETVNLWILDTGNDEISSSLQRICAVVEDNGGMVKEM